MDPRSALATSYKNFTPGRPILIKNFYADENSKCPNPNLAAPSSRPRNAKKTPRRYGGRKEK